MPQRHPSRRTTHPLTPLRRTPTHRARALALVPLVLLTALALAACGDDSSSSSGTTTTARSSTTATTAASASGSSGDRATVAVASTALGKILVDADGRTLYAFTPDTATKIACTGSCAQAWPPAVSPSSPTGDGVSAAITVVKRADGTSQVAVAGHPLYQYAGDGAAGDTNGQGSGGKWFVVAPDGKLVTSSGGSTTTSSTVRSGY